MENLEKYNQTFVENFSVDVSALNDDFGVDTVESWDSVAQLSLVSAIEDVFDIMIDAEDILAFRSYGAGKDILQKYQVKI
jgi:acyl carrier protein